jgi:hypothetical protein
MIRRPDSVSFGRVRVADVVAAPNAFGQNSNCRASVSDATLIRSLPRRDGLPPVTRRLQLLVARNSKPEWGGRVTRETESA